MENFLKKDIEGNKFELIIDTKIYSKEIIFKSAFIFLDKWYFFFKQDNDKNIILQFTSKEWVDEKPENIIWDFSWELLNNILREKVFEENKEVRTEIITSAIQNSLRESELPNNWKGYDQTEWNYFDKDEEIDFDKDIDDILKEIENDPELKIDEEEIEKILKEIEEESEKENIEEETTISVDLEWIEKAKKDLNK